jgi:hypothetical protein
MEKNQKTILVCPLNWGLGHASRDIPVIRRLIIQGFHVVVASEPPLTQLISNAVPEADTDFFPGPRITYTRSKLLIPKLLSLLPGWILWIGKERKIINQLVDKHKPSCIISDNRYGARHPDVRSIIITHQLMIKMPLLFKWLERPMHRIIRQLILKFDECWVPDFKMAASLAGDLVHKFPLPQNVRLIGPLSRFMDEDIPESHFPENPNIPEVLVILSGPEPQKSLLRDKSARIIAASELSAVIITGDPDKTLGDSGFVPSRKMEVFPHLPQSLMRQLISETPIVVSRAGYSTIMDLWYLQKSALLIPTPGQTEQEYLAFYNKSRHSFISQEHLSTQDLNSPAFQQKDRNDNPQTSQLLESAIRDLTAMISEHSVHH